MEDYNSDFNRGYNNYNGIGNRPDRPTNGTIDGEWAAWRNQQASIKPFPSASGSSSAGRLTSIASSIAPSLPIVGGGGGSGAGHGFVGGVIGSIWGLIKTAVVIGALYGAFDNFANHSTRDHAIGTTLDASLVVSKFVGGLMTAAAPDSPLMALANKGQRYAIFGLGISASFGAVLGHGAVSLARVGIEAMSHPR